MTTKEAYEYTLELIEEMRQEGIKVKIEPYRNPKDETIKKYSGPERIDPGKWVNVHFYPETPEQISLISTNAKKLGWMGIGFDTGGCKRQRDWELDWSFHYTGKPDSEMENGRDIVEDLISGVDCENGEIL